jgi:hypothetical protein
MMQFRNAGGDNEEEVGEGVMDLTGWIRDRSHMAANLEILLGDSNVILKLSRSHLVTIRLQIVYLAT